MVKICPKCQKENVDKNNFCEYCGSDLPKIEEEKRDESINEDKISSNERKIKKQEKEIEKNKQIIAKQQDNISNSKTVNNDEFHKIKYKLLYWNDKKTNEYVFSKTKAISIVIFLFFFILYYIRVDNPGLIGGIIIGLFFAIPAFIIGFIIHYLMNRK